MSTEFELQEQSLEEDIIASVDLILSELGIDSTTVKSIQPIHKRPYYRAIVNWLTKYKSPINSSRIDSVKGILESFYHFCQLEEWERAGLTLSTQANPLTQAELQEQLSLWGYYREQIERIRSIRTGRVKKAGSPSGT
jgi:hypothetical protein